MNDSHQFGPQSPGPLYEPATRADQQGQNRAVRYEAPAAPTNSIAILALVLGLTVPIGGIVCGHIALSQIRRTHEQGRGLALAGLIIGYSLCGLIALFVVAYIGLIAVLLGSALAVAHGVSG